MNKVISSFSCQLENLVGSSTKVLTAISPASLTPNLPWLVGSEVLSSFDFWSSLNWQTKRAPAANTGLSHPSEKRNAAASELKMVLFLILSQWLIWRSGSSLTVKVSLHHFAAPAASTQRVGPARRGACVAVPANASQSISNHPGALCLHLLLRLIIPHGYYTITNTSRTGTSSLRHSEQRFLSFVFCPFVTFASSCWLLHQSHWQ